MSRTAYAHVQRAVEIWRQAYIDFVPVWQRITKEDAGRLLDKDQTLHVHWSFIERDDEPGRTERSRLAKLKKRRDALAVFFVSIDGPTRADPDHFQAYIGNDVANAPLGRTVAHEIGHLLLGSGHTGNRDIGWKSGLMYAGNSAGGQSTDISRGDAEVAQKRATGIPSD